MRAWIALALAVSTQLAVSAAFAQGQDHRVRLVGVEALPQEGSVLALVSVTDPKLDAVLGSAPGAGSFSIALQDGKASIQNVKRAKDLRRPSHTVIAIDHSLSFKRFEEASWTLADHIGAAHQAGDTLSLLLFGWTAKSYDSTRATANFAAAIADGKTVPWEKVTRLNSHLADAVDKAALEQPNALKNVILLSDGDEEGDYDSNTLIDKAVQKGVRIHALVFLLDPTQARAKKIDRIKEIAERTGGESAVFTDVADAKSVLDGWRRLAGDYLAIEATLRCLTKDDYENTFRVDYAPGGQREAWTRDQHFVESPNATIYQPCGTAALDCQPWQVPNVSNDACEAKPCTADPDCGASNHCAGAKCAAGTSAASAGTGIPLWAWWAMGALGLLLVVLLVWLARRKSGAIEREAEAPAAPPAAEPEPAPEPPPPEVPPPAPTKLVAPVDGLPDFPETHLVVLDGDYAGRKFRVFKRHFQLGAVDGEGNDAAIGVGTVSTTHARLELFPSGAMWLRDLDSSNGTFVNGEKLPSGQKRQVKVGDQIGLGLQVRIEIQQPGAMKPSADAPSRRVREASSPPPGPVGPESAPSPTAASPTQPAKKKNKKHTIIDT